MLYLVSSFPPRQQHSLSFAKVDAGSVKLLQPGVIVTFGKPEEQPLCLYALAIDQEHVESPWAQIAKPLHQYIRLMKGFSLRTSSSNSRMARSGVDIVNDKFHMSPGLLCQAVV